jgi:hypothetical protein
MVRAQMSPRMHQPKHKATGDGGKGDPPIHDHGRQPVCVTLT